MKFWNEIRQPSPFSMAMCRPTFGAGRSTGDHDGRERQQQPAGPPEGRGIEKSEDQPHAPALDHEPGTPMWGSDPEREAVSVARSQR
jgi:hypothetical protein